MPVPELLRYELGDEVTAFSTMRRGGYGTGDYAEFNANSYCGDDKSVVEKNKDLLCRQLCIDKSSLIIPHQTHGTGVLCIDADFLCLTAAEQEPQLEGVDALVTGLHDVCISVSTADCVPVLMYDCQHHVVAAVHAGWRGTVAGIVDNVLTVLRGEYGTLPTQIKAVIGPSISIDSFEVGDEVYEMFSDAGFPMLNIAKRYPAQGVTGDKWHLDLWEANRHLLLQCGVLEENIAVAGICTYQQHERFFSARRLGIQSGRILNGIMIKKK